MVKQDPASPDVVEKTPANMAIGSNLTEYALLIAAVYIALIIVLIFVDNYFQPALKNTTGNEALIKAFYLEKEKYRVFLLELTKIVLLNLLLPVLTALVGYTFGVKTRKYSE